MSFCVWWWFPRKIITGLSLLSRISWTDAYFMYAHVIFVEFRWHTFDHHSYLSQKRIPLGAPLMGSTCCHTGWGVPILYLVYEIWSWKDASLQYFHLEEPDFANSFMFSMPAILRHLKFNRCVTSPQKASRIFKVSHSFRGKIFSLKKSCSHPVLSSFHITLTKPCSPKRKAWGNERKRKSSQVLRSTLSTCVGYHKKNSRFSRSIFQVPLVIMWKGGDMKDMFVSRYPDRFHLGAHLWWLCWSDQFVIFSALAFFSPRSVSPGWIAESPGECHVQMSQISTYLLF